ncbi:hypothetical protein A6833_11700 [Salmonella enterica]|nr:hypothetical protein [Salmonella enterica]EBQ3515123.1 hypothetical protein [Salmonella enterica]EBQ3579550.1 hypothetical protein [Salmonella enterica]
MIKLPFYRIDNLCNILNNGLMPIDLINLARSGDIKLSIQLHNDLVNGLIQTNEIIENIYIENNGTSEYSYNSVYCRKIHFEYSALEFTEQEITIKENGIYLVSGKASGLWVLPVESFNNTDENNSITIDDFSISPIDCYYFHSAEKAMHVITCSMTLLDTPKEIKTMDLYIDRSQANELIKIVTSQNTTTTGSIHGNIISNANRRIAAMHAIFQILEAYYNEILDDKGEIIDIALLSKVKEDWGRIHGDKVKIFNDKTLLEIIKELQERPDESQSIYIKPKQDKGK